MMRNEKKIIRVVGAAIIGDGKVLVAQRPYSDKKYKSLKWEFPGGKIEADETETDAIKREILEELSCRIDVDELLPEFEYEYPDFVLRMTICICHLSVQSVPECLEHNSIRWVSPEDFPLLDWAAADALCYPMVIDRIRCRRKSAVGRFAPSPSGRMHLGNVFAALISWLSVRKQRGRWILRIEDLDPQRSRAEYARLIEDDLHWLGLDWDEGGMADAGHSGPYRQSLRSGFYESVLNRLEATGLTYPCFCTRADIMATQAPHESDGRVVYGSTCRPKRLGGTFLAPPPDKAPRATRLFVPDKIISFTDRLYGRQEVNLASHCGDFVLRRADGAWAYQLAVVVDDALMGVTEVVRGSDLLLSSAQQIYLYNLLDAPAPEFAHIPLLCNASGQRLSKRDASLSMAELRTAYSPSQIIGRLAYAAGLIIEPMSISASELIELFSWSSIRPLMTIEI